MKETFGRRKGVEFEKQCPGMIRMKLIVPGFLM